MYKIVFVCSGNMCRSPFAETVLKQMLEQRMVCNVEVTSVGTLNLQNTPYDENMVRIANELGYEMAGNSKYMCHEVVYDADLILVMSKHHRDKLTQLVPYANWDRIHLFNQYCLNEDTEVPDPHYQTEAVYRKAAEMIVKGCEALADRMAKETNYILIDFGCGGTIDLTYDRPYRRLPHTPQEPGSLLHTLWGLPKESPEDKEAKERARIKEMLEKMRLNEPLEINGITFIDTPGLTPSDEDEDDKEQEE